MSAISVGFDIDGTITANPGLFACLSREILERGGNVHVVSSRSENARAETLLELDEYGVQFDHLYLLPSMQQSESICPHPNLDWYARFLWGKVAYALDQGLTHFVDDDMKVAALFNKYAANVVFMMAEDELSLRAILRSADRI